MSDQATPAPFASIQLCEAAIARIQAARRFGPGDDEAVGADCILVRDTVSKRLFAEARRLGKLAPVTTEEIFEAMIAKLYRDILNPQYVSLQTGFGSYLRMLPISILRDMLRKYAPDRASIQVERLDEPVGDEGVERHEFIGDPRAEQDIEAVGAREALNDAIRQLSTQERQVLAWRLDGVANQEIAERLHISPAGATRIYQRAKSTLQTLLAATKE